MLGFGRVDFLPLSNKKSTSNNNMPTNTSESCKQVGGICGHAGLKPATDWRGNKAGLYGQKGNAKTNV